MHDDCVVALGLAAERARHFVEVSAAVVAGIAPPEPVAIDPRVYFPRMREDPEWGWEAIRCN